MRKLVILSFHLFEGLMTFPQICIPDSMNILLLGTSSCLHHILFERHTCRMELAKICGWNQQNHSRRNCPNWELLVASGLLTMLNVSNSLTYQSTLFCLNFWRINRSCCSIPCQSKHNASVMLLVALNAIWTGCPDLTHLV